MKKKLTLFLIVFVLIFSSSCKANDYILTEDTFFLVMTNMQYYPEQYVGASIEYDCFTYDLTDVNGTTYRCGVRKCSAGYGCQCGKDTIIGFLLNYDGEIPDPKNQSEDTVEKTWVHLKGTVASNKKTQISIYAYDENGKIDKSTVEIIEFLTFNVEELSIVNDYSNLNYYVTK